jgi:hypothetical protein
MKNLIAGIKNETSLTNIEIIVKLKSFQLYIQLCGFWKCIIELNIMLNNRIYEVHCDESDRLILQGTAP